MVDGRPAARQFDATAHPGMLIEGAKSVYIGGPSTNAIAFALRKLSEFLGIDLIKVLEVIAISAGIVAVFVLAAGAAKFAAALSIVSGVIYGFLTVFIDDKYFIDAILSRLNIAKLFDDAVKQASRLRELRVPAKVVARKLKRLYQNSKGKEVLDEFARRFPDLIKSQFKRFSDLTFGGKVDAIDKAVGLPGNFEDLSEKLGEVSYNDTPEKQK